MEPPDTQVTTSVLALLKYHKWFKFTIVSQKNDQWKTIAEDLRIQAEMREEFPAEYEDCDWYSMDPEVRTELALARVEEVFHRVFEEEATALEASGLQALARPACSAARRVRRTTAAAAAQGSRSSMRYNGGPPPPQNKPTTPNTLGAADQCRDSCATSLIKLCSS